MKKYFFGALAIVLAVGLSSFTTQKAPFANYVFKYFGPDDASQADIQLRTNWKVIISGTPYSTCSPDIQEDACTFTTSDALAVGTYLVSNGDGTYRPSDAMTIVSKASASNSSQFVFDRAEKTSDQGLLSNGVQNVDELD